MAPVERQAQAVAADRAEDREPQVCRQGDEGVGGAGRTGDDDARRALAEQRHVGAQGARRQREGGAERRRRSRRQRAALDPARDAALGEGHGEAALGAVVGAPDETSGDAFAQHPLERLFELEVDVGHAAFDAAVVDLLVLGAVEPGGSGRAQQHDQVALGLEARVAVLRDVVEDAQHADHGRRVDGVAEALVVEAHVARHDRRVERLAGSAMPSTACSKVQ